MNTTMALQLEFERARRKAMLRDLLAVVTRRPNRLVPYHEARRGASGVESYRGIASVPIARIVGSVDRFEDFDRAFLPRKRHHSGRWQSVARAHFAGGGLPPVKLYEIGGDYFVQDGHHRISVARLGGQQFIDAEVTAASVPAAAAGDETRRSRPAPRLATGLRSLARGARPLRRAVAPAGVAVLGCGHAVASCSCP